MSFNPELIAKQLYEQLESYTIIDVTMCMTRLRLSFKNKPQIKIESLKIISGVLGVVETADQLQIILGPGKVNQVYNYFIELQKKNSSEILDQNVDKNNLQDSIKQKNTTPFKLLLKKIANIFIPIIPAFIACGLILGVFNIFSKYQLINNFTTLPFDNTQVGIILKLIANSLPFALAILVGVNTAKEFNGTPAIGGVLATLLNMPELTRLHIFNEAAVPGRGGIIAVLLVVIFAAYLERGVRKIVPDVLDLFLTPLIVVLLSGFGALFFIAAFRWFDFRYDC